MGIKEQVKCGKLTPQEAITKVSKDSHTYGWCKRRGNKVVAPPTETSPTPAPAADEKAKSKYKQKKGKFKTI